MNSNQYLDMNHFSTQKEMEGSIDERLFIPGYVERERTQLEQSRMRRNLYYLGIVASAVCAGVGLYLCHESDFRETLPYCALLSGLAGTGFVYILSNNANEDVRMQKDRMDKLKNDIFKFSRN